MKKHLLPAFFILVFLQNLNAQTSVIQPCGTAITVPSSACLACAGSIWNNEANVTVADGNPADVGLMQNGFCFQSNCSYSRYLACTQFGFSIPGNAGIIGIEIKITNKASALASVKDTIIQMVQSGTGVGSNYCVPALYDSVYTTTTYGGPADLWGMPAGSWTPVNINDPTSGVNIKVKNTRPVQASAYVDYVSMTVYYTTPLGIIESQTSGTNSFFISQQYDELLCSFSNEKYSEKNTIIIYDLTGKIVLTENLFSSPTGKQSYNINISKLNSGIYLAQLISGNSMRTKKICVVK